jgi:hypothetical protein|tara:strand:+ start:2787 stop:3320 length:534 start_codon:yes stop_codon:yes gene_type:complete
MKLRYSIPEKIWWIQDFLSYDIYKGIHDAIIKERAKINLHTSKGIWGDNLIDRIVPPLRSQVSNYKPFEILKTLVKHNVYFQLKNVEEMSTTIHYMKKGAGINWHDDGQWKYGATYYINRRWNTQWGGEFMFTNQAGHGWIPPVGNSLVIVKSPIEHKVNPVLTTIMPRISVQMFMK